MMQHMSNGCVYSPSQLGWSLLQLSLSAALNTPCTECVRMWTIKIFLVIFFPVWTTENDLFTFKHLWFVAWARSLFFTRIYWVSNTVIEGWFSLLRGELEWRFQWEPAYYLGVCFSFRVQDLWLSSYFPPLITSVMRLQGKKVPLLVNTCHYMCKWNRRINM